MASEKGELFDPGRCDPMSELGQSLPECHIRYTSDSPPDPDIACSNQHFAFVPILLQKSKVASVRFFGETLKRQAIDASHNLSRATEVAYEFSVRR